MHPVRGTGTMAFTQAAIEVTIGITDITGADR
jgi:hypothetical protein